eukprot:3567348-Pleurochrysis_carterae.AAC.2
MCRLPFGEPDLERAAGRARGVGEPDDLWQVDHTAERRDGRLVAQLELEGHVAPAVDVADLAERDERPRQRDERDADGAVQPHRLERGRGGHVWVVLGRTRRRELLKKQQPFPVEQAAQL